MRTELFEEIIKETQDITNRMLISKGKEYATVEDRLHNFRVAAQFKDEFMQTALWGFTVKHLVSISDMIKQTQENYQHDLYSEDQWDEKIMDAINYLTMLRAVRRDCLPEPGSIMLKERG